jgi:hypothetical protein
MGARGVLVCCSDYGHWGRSMRHNAGSLLAGLHAAAARFCTDAAMLMHVGVPLAFLAACPAGRRTSVKHALNHLFV